MANKGWESVRLENILESVFAGAWGDSPTDSRRANVRVLRATNIDSEGRLDYSNPALRVLEAREISRKRLQQGDLLLEASGGGPGTPVGRVALHDVEPAGLDYVCSNFFRVLRPKRKLVHPGYLAHVLAEIYRSPRIWRYQQQTTGLVNLKLGDYLKQSLWLPPIAEQAGIVEILAGFLEAERGIEASIAKLGVTRQAALSSAIESEIPAGEEGTVLLGSLLQRIEAGWSPACEAEPPGPGEWGVIRVSAVTSGKFSPDESKRLPQGLAPRPDLEVRPGDLLMARANGARSLVGVVCLVGRTRDKLMLSDKTLRLIPAEERSNVDFLFTVLSGEFVRAQVEAFLSGSTGQGNISQTAVRGLKVPNVPRAGQRKVAALALSFDEQISSEVKELDKLRRLKHGLVDDLLSGRVSATAVAA
ncbi:restriction endonuclease subunit S [Streptomyces pseudogriseolus]|uniref:restriction endonuclease subunit S n=1 Tax=Streptomyces pseudogriseolus TaxID=36817 RepID=UPI003FA1A9F2